MKIRITTIILSFMSLFSMRTAAQEITSDTLHSTVEGILQSMDVKNRLKVSGYIQAQYQIIDSAGAKSYAGGDFPTGVDKRFQLRRGRVKFQYDGALNDKGWSLSQYVFQIDVSQNGLTIKDLYAKFTDPWTGWFSVTAGMQNRPFGFEIGYSSGLRESPERGRMSQIIFPNERDLGAMLTIQGSKFSNWNWLKLEVGYFNGTGGPSAGANTSDFDKYKDLIGHLSASRASKSEKVKWGLGVSFYDGGFRQDQSNHYVYDTDSAGVKGFTIDKKKADVSAYAVTREEAKRKYVGGDGQVSIDWFLGITTLRAEYIQGEQPSLSDNTTSLSAAIPTTTATTYSTTIDTITMKATTTATTTTTVRDVYSRNFNGAYFYFLQNIGQTPLQAIVKYDWYDPNTDVAGDEIGKKAFGNTSSTANTTNPTDLKYTTLGLGLAYRWDAQVKLTAYYDMVTNETSANLTGGNAIYQHDLKDNVFTLRVQVKF